MRTKEAKVAKVEMGIKVKPASEIRPGDAVLKPHDGRGILLARVVTKVEVVDHGKWVELGLDDGALSLLMPLDRVAVL